MRVSLIIILGIVLIIAGSILIYLNIEQSIQSLLEHKKNHGRETAVTFVNYLDDLKAVLLLTSQLPSVYQVNFAESIKEELHGIPQSDDPAKRKIAQDILMYNPSLEAVFFAMPDGRMYINEPYHRQENLKTLDFRFRDWYVGVTTTKSTYVSETFQSYGANENAVAVTVPVYDESSNFVGIWGGIIDLDYFNNLFDDLVLEKNERVSIIDHKGNTVIDSIDFLQQDVILNQNHKESVNLALSGKEGTSIHINDNTKFFSYYTPVNVGSHQWAMVFEEPYDDMFSEINLKWIVLFVFLIASSTVLFLIIRLVKSKQSIQKKSKFELSHNVVLVIAIVAVSIVAFAYMTQPPVPQTPLKSQFLIENLKGDSVDTWINWKVPRDELFHIHVEESSYLTQERLKIIEEVINSKDIVELPDSTNPSSKLAYYKGWAGAIESANKINTKHPIPIHFHTTTTTDGVGNIIIKLSNLSDPDGYSGYTKLFVDEQYHQILKATITIYGIDSLSSSDLEVITRHELGHAFGLAHSTATEDLMAPIITTNYPYISPCDINALVGLYDGKSKSKVTCEN
jgi:hypothetical protein